MWPKIFQFVEEQASIVGTIESLNERLEDPVFMRHRRTVTRLRANDPMNIAVIRKGLEAAIHIYLRRLTQQELLKTAIVAGNEMQAHNAFLSRTKMFKDPFEVDSKPIHENRRLTQVGIDDFTDTREEQDAYLTFQIDHLKSMLTKIAVRDMGSYLDNENEEDYDAEATELISNSLEEIEDRVLVEDSILSPQISPNSYEETDMLLHFANSSNTNTDVSVCGVSTFDSGDEESNSETLSEIFLKDDPNQTDMDIADLLEFGVEELTDSDISTFSN